MRNITLAVTQAIQSHLAGFLVCAYEPIPYPADATEIDIDDCHEVYGDQPRLAENVVSIFCDIPDPCPDQRNPTGQHIFGGPNDRHCVYCGERSGLDR